MLALSTAMIRVGEVEVPGPFNFGRKWVPFSLPWRAMRSHVLLRSRGPVAWEAFVASVAAQVLAEQGRVVVLDRRMAGVRDDAADSRLLAAFARNDLAPQIGVIPGQAAVIGDVLDRHIPVANTQRFVLVRDPVTSHEGKGSPLDAYQHVVESTSRQLGAAPSSGEQGMLRGDPAMAAPLLLVMLGPVSWHIPFHAAQLRALGICSLTVCTNDDPVSAPLNVNCRTHIDLEAWPDKMTANGFIRYPIDGSKNNDWIAEAGLARFRFEPS